MKQTISEEMNIQDEWYKEADTMTYVPWAPK